ncbi:unnamed protein product [Effrenium voratum]|uniref:Uncharacterized protein n=1 Tax=Effrenium voratum TaxID=2562239 RepID=A0AA36HX21_9DINO|nr:unnamed protein product [Effrenium voratum]CAJ1376946.1 unnamed protein product [Effrenium voratum]
MASDRFQDELRLWEADAERVRKLVAEIPGPCVLNLAEENILSFGQGDWALIERDVAAAFSPDLASVILDCFREEVQTCLAVRRELINFKKLCLHLWQSATSVEKDLRQLASFYYTELVGDPLGAEAGDTSDTRAVRRARYVDMANALNECRGAVAAMFDARHFSKAVCKWPRHPASGVPWKFEALPQSLELWKPLDQAQHFLESYHLLDAYYAAVHEEADGYAKATRPPSSSIRPWKSERDFVESDIGPRSLGSLLAAVQAGLQLPQQAARYIELVLIARGAAKALAIRLALRRYIAALREVEARASTLEQKLKVLAGEDPFATPLTDTAVSAGLHLHSRRHLLVIKGMLPVVSEFLRWLDPIADMRSDASRLFVSGSKGAAAFVPRGIAQQSLLEATAMLAELEPGGSGWPRSARPANEAHASACRTCGVKLNRLWLHRGLCLLCESKVRAQGRCPYGGERCGSRSFCPHDNRCVVCEQWSCERCKLLRGDGEDVWQLVMQRQPSFVFLDFDRTLCTTKAGASPLQGTHSLDSDLVTVCCQHRKVLIVTRSPRSEDICVFLRQHGVRARLLNRDEIQFDHQADAGGLRGDVWVRSVKREGFDSKAAVILKEMEAEAEATGIFADDDIKELTDEALRGLVDGGRLLRLLFVRSGGKE